MPLRIAPLSWQSTGLPRCETDELVHLSCTSGAGCQPAVAAGTAAIQSGTHAIRAKRVGERLSPGGPATVTAVRVELLAEPVKVYNFQVADWHTYYAAPEADKPFVWVHNANYKQNSWNKFQSENKGRFKQGEAAKAYAGQPLGRGQTGRNTPNSLAEKLAMDEAMSGRGRVTDIEMGDSRWPASEGWVKMEHVHRTAPRFSTSKPHTTDLGGPGETNITIHFLRNLRSGAVDDFKFKN